MVRTLHPRQIDKRQFFFNSALTDCAESEFTSSRSLQTNQGFPDDSDDRLDLEENNVMKGLALLRNGAQKAARMKSIKSYIYIYIWNTKFLGDLALKGIDGRFIVCSSISVRRRALFEIG